MATNYHVVEGAETLSVGFCDSTACEAKVKGYDSEKDLAVVAVSWMILTAIQWMPLRLQLSVIPMT
ncbi:MAG: hypothetical protein ACLSGK_15005 [Lachnospiraceae bacterium]